MSNLDQPLVNRVAKSPLLTINLEEFFPKGKITELDIKQFLFKELILKEKEFRKQVKEFDWSQFQGHILCIYCSTDAIIPVWAYMLIATYVKDVTLDLYIGQSADYLKSFYRSRIERLDASMYQDRMIVIKGCSAKPVPESAYMDLTTKLLPVAKSIMYGEPCSTVPIYKRKK